MTTLPLSTSDLKAAIDALRAGKPIALPTETVYGLAADACNDAAVAQIYAMKGRPAHNPLITHVLNVEMARRYALWSPLAERLAAQFWPGPLTLVLPKRVDCPISDAVLAGSDTLAVRCPSHPVARAVIAAFDGGLAAPSANRSGRISPTSSAHVRDEFPNHDLIILEGGPCVLGIESTIVDCTQTEAIAILRPGSIREEDFAQHHIALRPASLPEHGLLLSPGQLISHYAPMLPVRLNVSEVSDDEALLTFGNEIVTGNPATCINLSQSGNLEEAAAHLFSGLRALDAPHYRAIAVAPIPMLGVGIAINDRLKRAAAPRS